MLDIPDSELFAHEPDAEGRCACGTDPRASITCSAAMFEHIEGLRHALKYAEQAKTHAQNQQTRLVQALAKMIAGQHMALSKAPTVIGAMLIGLGLEPAVLPKEDADLLVQVAVEQMKRTPVDPRVFEAALTLVRDKEQEQLSTLRHPGATPPAGNSSEGCAKPPEPDLGPHETA